MKLVEAGGNQGERQPQCYYPSLPPHSRLQGSIRGSSLIHLSCELVMGRMGGGRHALSRVHTRRLSPVSSSQQEPYRYATR